MRSLDVFVLPSFAEGTSKSVIEAMAHQLPIVTTEVGGLPDLLTAGSGILVPAGNSFLLAEAMERLAVDVELRSQLGKQARKRYQQLFSARAVLPLLLRTYSRLACQSVADDEHEKHPWEFCDPGEREDFRKRNLSLGKDSRNRVTASGNPAFEVFSDMMIADEKVAG